MADPVPTPAPTPPPTAPDDDAPRTVALRMRLGFDTAEAFEAGYLRFVTAQGIFLASRNPRPPGTALRFELQTRDGRARLLVAEGRVVGVRQPDPEHPRRVPGMHVRFTRLTEESRQRIQRMAAVLAAATPFGATPAPAAMPAEATPAMLAEAMPAEATAAQAYAQDDALRSPSPAPIDLAFQAALRPVPPPPSAAAPATQAPPASSPEVAPRRPPEPPPSAEEPPPADDLDLPDASESPFRDVFARVFGMGTGNPPPEDPFDRFLQADLPTADGADLEEVPELPPDAILS